MEQFEPVKEAIEEVEKEIAPPAIAQPEGLFVPVVESDIRVAATVAQPAGTTKFRKRLRHSCWTMLWNTNKKFVDQADSEYEKAANDLKQLLEDFKSSVGSFIQFKNRDESHQWNRKYIKNVQFQAEVELGNKQYRVHAHAMLTIDHWSCIQLDYEKVKQFVKKVFPDGYISIQQRQSPLSFEEYMRKNDESEREPEVSGRIVV